MIDSRLKAWRPCADEGAAGRPVVRPDRLNKRESKDMVDAFFDLIVQSLIDGKDVKLSGFGNFQIRTRRPPGRNLRVPGRSRSRPGAWSPFTPAANSRSRQGSAAGCAA